MKADPTTFRIQASEWHGRPPKTIAEHILSLPGLPVNAINFPSLILDEEAFSVPITQWSGGRAFGRGVYVFRRSEGAGHWPIYVGQAPDEFLRRIFQQLDPTPRHGFGFNAMLQYIARDTKGFGDHAEGLQKAQEWLLAGGSLVLIDMPSDRWDERAISYWENRLIEAMYRITDEPKWMQQWPQRRHKYIREKGGCNG